MGIGPPFRSSGGFEYIFRRSRPHETSLRIQLKTLTTVLFAVSLVTLLSSVANAQTPAATSVDADLQALLAIPGDPARGKKAFAACDVCHRKNASGRSDGSVPRLTGQHSSVVVKQVLDIRADRRNNPSMQPIVADQAFTMTKLADIAAYLQSLPFEGSVGKGPGKDLALGKQLYERDCASCHGTSGAGDAAKNSIRWSQRSTTGTCCARSSRYAMAVGATPTPRWSK
jgi:cytochrome c553